MARKRVFVSFDYTNDRQYKFLLTAFSSNPLIDISFIDKSSGEINSSNISVVKAALTRKISEADCTLVIIGEEANKIHRDSMAIGYRNWQNFEIAKSKELGKKLIAVKLDSTYVFPDELYNCQAKWVSTFSVENIQKVLLE